MLKNKIIEYRNTHRDSRVLMSAVLGELDRISKEPTDTECIGVIKKMIESNKECNQFEENKILELFLPQQLSEEDILYVLNQEKFPNIGECMKWFKTNKSGLYDGKLLSTIFKTFNN